MGETPRAQPVQAWAYASGCTAVEALRRAGRQPDRAAVVKALESVQRLALGVTQPLSFGPRQRHGQWESRIVRLDDSGAGLQTESAWRAPRQP